MTDPATARRRWSVLDAIEWVGNKLPEPVTLFALGAALVMAVSWVAVRRQWQVAQELPQPVMVPVLDDEGRPVLDDETGLARMQPEIDPATGRARLEWRPTGVVFAPRSLLSRDGIDWALRSMVDNFRMFPPLGVVLVGMLGIGVAERTGLLAAVLKALMLALRGGLESFTPPRWRLADRALTPLVIFIGVTSSLATDAGYVVLPPLAAALYKSVGRSPLAGLAAVFAGVSAGFSANLFITGLEPMLAQMTGMGAAVLEEGYRVNPACNWWFMIVSQFVITLAGWFVTAALVERRLNRRAPDDGGPAPPSDEELAAQRLAPAERRGLAWAGLGALAVAAATLAAILIPGAPLHTYKLPVVVESGRAALVPDEASLRALEEELAAAPPGDLRRVEWRIAERLDADPGAASPDEAYRRDDGTLLVPSQRLFDRWIDAIVPLLLVGFFVPGIAYGAATRAVRSDRDAAKLMLDTMAAMAPIILLAFVAGQFVEYFKYSRLDQMMAMAGGMWLGKSGLSPYALVVAFVGVTLVFNLFMGSMSAKYALFAPIFVPMFMLVGISPELTQAAYRVGDSVSNVVTPLNPYLIIILVFMRKYVPKGGMGTLIATMAPYTLVFALVWTVLLVFWMWTGLPLGIDGGLWHEAAAPPAALVP
jgi:aminobenzoyl-glutamate transport protein